MKKILFILCKVAVICVCERGRKWDAAAMIPIKVEDSQHPEYLSALEIVGQSTITSYWNRELFGEQAVTLNIGIYRLYFYASFKFCYPIYVLM